MSTAEGYDLHLYCDGKDGACSSRAEFGGINRRDCLKQARKHGWKIFKKPAPETSPAGGRFVLCRDCQRGKNNVRT